MGLAGISGLLPVNELGLITGIYVGLGRGDLGTGLGYNRGTNKTNVSTYKNT